MVYTMLLFTLFYIIFLFLRLQIYDFYLIFIIVLFYAILQI